ncbi:hypothetical protein BJX96DRAFT_126919 [Aspergillus floccosus]
MREKGSNKSGSYTFPRMQGRWMQDSTNCSTLHLCCGLLHHHLPRSLSAGDSSQDRNRLKVSDIGQRAGCMVPPPVSLSASYRSSRPGARLSGETAPETNGMKGHHCESQSPGTRRDERCPSSSSSSSSSTNITVARRGAQSRSLVLPMYGPSIVAAIQEDGLGTNRLSDVGAR